MDARTAGNKPAGIGMVVYHLIKALNKYDDIEFAIITDVLNSKEIKELKEEVVKTYELGGLTAESFGIFKYFKFVQECIEDYKPDIFWEPNNLIPVKINNPYGMKIVTIHDVFPMSEPKQFSLLYRLYFKYGLNTTLSNFDYVIYDSMDSKNETETYFKKANHIKSQVGYIIVPKMSERVITDNGDFLYLGTLESRKGTDILLDAYDMYRNNGGQRGLRLAGKVSEEDIKKKLDETINKYPEVKYLGYVSLDEKIDELASCHAFLFPSRAEGFGIPVIEAMNYDKSIIASDLQTIKEVTDSSVSFFHLDKNYDLTISNLSNKMLEDKDIVNKEKYKEIVTRYTPEVSGKRFYEILKDLFK